MRERARVPRPRPIPIPLCVERRGAGVNAWRFTVLGYQAGLARPLFLALIPIAVALGLIALVRGLMRRSALGRAVPDRLSAALAPGVSLLLPSLQSGFYALGLMLMAFSLAQPQCGSKSGLTKRRGIDVVVAIDASRSMLVRAMRRVAKLWSSTMNAAWWMIPKGKCAGFC